MKSCKRCKIEKSDIQFYSNGPTFRAECKPCTRIIQRAGKYRTTVENLEAIYLQQNSCCAICKREFDLLNLHVDHDHECCPHDKNSKKCGKCIRGLLCVSCNSGLGLFSDNVSYLNNAIIYLGIIV